MVASKSLPPPICSPHQLMAMAYAMERESARRYGELAARMRLRGEMALASLFDFFASIEEKHAVHVTTLTEDALDQSIDLAQASWEVPENFDEEAGSSHTLTPYLALAIAVRNEERAFAFYTYVAAEAPDERTRTIAEDLAREELDHAALLRAERRRAYHAEDGTRRARAAIPASTDEFWTISLREEWRAARYHRALGRVLTDLGRDAAPFIAAASDEESCANEAAALTGQAVPEIAPEDRPTVEGGLRLLEEAFERYSDIAERTGDEEVMRVSMDMATRALRRLSLALGSLPAAR